MLCALRRHGVAQVLRASTSRSFVAKSTPQLLKFQPSTSSPAAFPQIHRSLHVSATRFQAAEAQAVASEEEPATPQRLTEFADLASHGLVDKKIIDQITRFMKIKTMTDVQSMTINETLQGDDVYVSLCAFLFSLCFRDADYCLLIAWPKRRPEQERLWPSSFP